MWNNILAQLPLPSESADALHLVVSKRKCNDSVLTFHALMKLGLTKALVIQIKLYSASHGATFSFVSHFNGSLIKPLIGNLEEAGGLQTHLESIKWQ